MHFFIFAYNIIILLYKYKKLENKNIKSEVFDFLKDLIIIWIIVILIRTFLAEPFQISGQSMADSYYDKEFIIVDRFSYLDIPGIKEWEIKRGDVIVFKPWVSEDKEYFIKRIIGLGWDTIKIKNWKVYLKKKWETEFKELNEKYLNKENQNHTKVWSDTWEKVFKVPENKFFAMWDNRNHSSDSRTCFSFSCNSSSRDSFITKDEIIWKVFLDLWYFNFRNFSFVNPGSSSYPDTKGLDTTPRWFDSPSSFKYE